MIQNLNTCALSQLLMNFTIKGVKFHVIQKLLYWNKWGDSHTEHILNGIPRHEFGSKIVKKAIRELVKNEWILAAMKTQEIHYSLNPGKKEEILNFFQEYEQNR